MTKNFEKNGVRKRQLTPDLNALHTMRPKGRVKVKKEEKYYSLLGLE